MTEKKRRTRLLVLSSFQKWFLINFIGYTFIFLLIFAVGIFLFFKVLANELIQVGGLLSSTFLSLVEKNIMLGATFLVFLVAALVGLAAYQALYFSRRIAGPIYALSRHLDRCLETNERKPFKLRDDDLFKDVAEKLNKVMEQAETRRK